MDETESFKLQIRQAIRLAKENGYTQARIGEDAGVTPQAVGQWAKTGKISNNSLSVLARMAGKPIEWFHSNPRVGATVGVVVGAMASDQGEGDMARERQRSLWERNVSSAPPVTGMCPEVSWVQAGQWAEVCHVELDPEAVNWYPRPPGASEQTFVLRVVGESMSPEYRPGTLIYVDPEKPAENGNDVIAVLTDSNEATFKRYIEEPGNGKLLKALNPNWHEIYLQINGNCHILGVVVADMRMR